MQRRLSAELDLRSGAGTTFRRHGSGRDVTSPTSRNILSPRLQALRPGSPTLCDPGIAAAARLAAALTAGGGLAAATLLEGTTPESGGVRDRFYARLSGGMQRPCTAREKPRRSMALLPTHGPPAPSSPRLQGPSRLAWRFNAPTSPVLAPAAQANRTGAPAGAQQDTPKAEVVQTPRLAFAAAAMSRVAPGELGSSPVVAMCSQPKASKTCFDFKVGAELKASLQTKENVEPKELAVITEPRVLAEVIPLSPPDQLARAQSALRPREVHIERRARSADPRRRRASESDVAPQAILCEAATDAFAESVEVCGQLLAQKKDVSGFPRPPALTRASTWLGADGLLSPRQSPPFKMLQSTVFGGKYAIGKYIGRGASATVWEASISDAKFRVAIKVFDQGTRDRRQAHRELRVLMKIKHPRILEAFEVVESPLYAQLVCELVDGESLRAFAQRQPSRRLPECFARLLYRQVVDGVSYCHDRMVAHRDLKLENLLLDKQDKIKIIDFGFAAQVATKDTKLKAFCGTPSYMAPEIIRGEGYSGFAADVWALGVVIFTLLTGSFPFTARTEMQLYAKIRRGGFLCPDALGDVPKRLIKGIIRAEAASRPSAALILQHAWLVSDGPQASQPLRDLSRQLRPSLGAFEKNQPLRQQGEKERSHDCNIRSAAWHN